MEMGCLVLGKGSILIVSSNIAGTIIEGFNTGTVYTIFHARNARFESNWCNPFWADVNLMNVQVNRFSFLCNWRVSAVDESDGMQFYHSSNMQQVCRESCGQQTDRLRETGPGLREQLLCVAGTQARHRQISRPQRNIDLYGVWG